MSASTVIPRYLYSGTRTEMSVPIMAREGILLNGPTPASKSWLVRLWVVALHGGELFCTVVCNSGQTRHSLEAFDVDNERMCTMIGKRELWNGRTTSRYVGVHISTFMYSLVRTAPYVYEWIVYGYRHSR